MANEFAARTSVEQVEEGADLAPKFDADGLIPAVTTAAATGELLMVGYMNAEALRNARSRPAKLITGAAAARCSGTKARRAASCRKSSSS